jgi:hypothetical protein
VISRSASGDSAAFESYRGALARSVVSARASFSRSWRSPAERRVRVPPSPRRLGVPEIHGRRTPSTSDGSAFLRRSRTLEPALTAERWFLSVCSPESRECHPQKGRGLLRHSALWRNGLNITALAISENRGVSSSAKSNGRPISPTFDPPPTHLGPICPRLDLKASRPESAREGRAAP